MNKLNIVILAAGKGTRMFSDTPKVLHQIGGKPILEHVIERACQLKPQRILVVVGYGGEQVKASLQRPEIEWVEQAEQKGTGHAVMQTLPYLEHDAITLVLLGDVPLIDTDICNHLISQASGGLSLLTYIKDDPTGYGRIIRNDQHQITAIVEHKDASDEQRNIKEVNTGIMAMQAEKLKNWLSHINNHNAQQEYYLTDIVALAVKEGINVGSTITQDGWSVTGINSKADLVQMERIYQKKKAEELLKAGVTLIDDTRIDIRGELQCGKDVLIDINAVFEGHVIIGNRVQIGANCFIKNAKIEDDVIIAPYSHIEDAMIGNNSRIGPFARLRPGTQLASESHVGNFVELKNAHVGFGSKINHLSYVGDAVVGRNVNIGAGTITCNYDGANKYQTKIEDDVFVGSDTQLIAPVTVGKGATIAAGSTITKDVPADTLTLCRAREQKSVSGWKRPVKQKKT